MKNSLTRFLVLSATALACLPGAQAQTYMFQDAIPYTAPQFVFSQQDLDAMLAPIALYPDALLAQILMAATYPLEVTEAARWSRSIPGVDPQEAVRSVARRNWDPSVQSLMAFPQVLQMMDSAPEWTQQLGNAFLAQQGQVWSTVQALRQRADAAGQLRSNDQLRVLRNDSLIVLEPANPSVIYVPYYDPLVVYGRWWWPGYAPMRWDPWPGYGVRRGSAPGVYLGSGIQVGLGFFFGQINWSTYRSTIVAPPDHAGGRPRPWHPGQDWQHDPQHRHGVPYVAPPSRPQPAPRAPQPERRPEFRDREPNPRTHVEPPDQGPGRARPGIDTSPRGTAPVQTPPPRTAVPEVRPEFRGHVPNPRVQVEPTAPSRPAEPADHGASGRQRPGGDAAPRATTPAVQAQPPRTAPPEARHGNAPVQNAAPASGDRPVSHREPAESRPAKAPAQRNEEPTERSNLSGK
jgi:hypothetical protein